MYSDGASRGNPGQAAYGALVQDPSGAVIDRISVAIGVATNNIAEYGGAIAALESALKHGARRGELRMDSELIQRQAIGRYKVRNANLLPHYKRLLELASRFDRLVFAHVPRELNKEADRLANQALDRL
jgi:ribonuclease HI